MRGGESNGATKPHRALCAFAVAVLAGHHLGTLLAPLGEIGDTRWADWVDLVVPYAVVGCAAAAIAAVGAGPRQWVAFGAFAVLYTQGHGIHLAANSIANVEPSDVVHLWDETVGHWLWYGGLAGIVLVLAVVFDEVPSPRRAIGVPLATAFGFTVFTNSVEGGTVVLGLATGVVFAVWGLRRIGRTSELLAAAYLVTLVCLAGWGAYWGGFPQFSELGWI
jgi:hypothetical protein